MIRKKSVAVISFLAIVSLTTIGFSTFYIGNDTNVTDYINSSAQTGDVLDLNDDVIINKTITYGITEDSEYPYYIFDNGTYSYISQDTGTVRLECQFYAYPIQEALGSDNFTNSFSFYFSLYDSSQTGILGQTENFYASNIFYNPGSGNYEYEPEPRLSYNGSSYCLTIQYTLSNLPASANSGTLEVSIYIPYYVDSSNSNSIYQLLYNEECFSFYMGLEI